LIGPIFEATALADGDSLAGRLIDGRGPVAFPPIAGHAAPRETAARLGVEVFGTTSARIHDKLARVLSGEGFVVTTGQQPVLFLGPLYVVYKTLSAIELAAALERRFGVPVVPVFWIASDDHDWDEIAQATLLDQNEETTVLRLHAPAGEEGRPAGPTLLGPAIGELLSSLSQLLSASEFTGMYIDHLMKCYSAESSVSAGFAGALRVALEPAEFAWLDAGHTGVKRASRPFFRMMLEEPTAVLAALEAGEKPLRAGGFEPPIAPIAGGLPLFYDAGDGRQRVLQAEADAFSGGREGVPEPGDTWRSRLEEEPERFSPNVSSRPALESWLMPVAATVLGPGEIAYWSQLTPLFDHFGVPFPPIMPRASLCAIEPRVEKTLRRMNLAVADLQDGGDAVAAAVTADARPAAVDGSISDLRSAIGTGASAVQSAIADELPGLKSAAGKAEKALHVAVTELNRVVDAAVREKQEATLSRVRRAAAQLWPGRRSQERVINPFHFLSRYGTGFVDAAGEHVRTHVSGFLAGPTDES
jgi:bacillithiol biosynthesis cysteine-adding enzyme BshC